MVAATALITVVAAAEAQVMEEVVEVAATEVLENQILFMEHQLTVEG